MRSPGLFWLVVLILPPIVALTLLPPFGQRMVTLIGVYALMGLGYQLIFGYLGALNLAQGALFGVGAYATALLAPALGGLALPVALVAAACLAAIVGGPLLRLQSHYFALATLALLKRPPRVPPLGAEAATPSRVSASVPLAFCVTAKLLAVPLSTIMLPAC